jgi:hypothetical protein
MMMKKSTSALAGIVVVAGIVGGTTAAAQAHPAASSNHLVGHHTSGVALARLQTMLGTSGTASVRTPLPNDGGSLGH